MKQKQLKNDRCIEMLKTAMGAVLPFFEDKSVIEIMLNQDCKLWVERLGKGREFTGIIVRPEDAIRFISIVASTTNTTINLDNPIISAEIPFYGSRFEGIIPPIVENPVFSIRQKAVMVFTLDDYVKQGIMTAKQCSCIKQAVTDKKNILLVGGTGSGKTTATNAILNEIAQTNDRIVILEDTKELQCTAEDTLFLRTQDNVSMTRLLKSTMRLRPDRIIVGEVRDAAALDLLKAWNTGHPGGISTIHANSAYDGLIRLEQLIQEAIITPQQKLIGQAVNLIVYIERFGHGRRIEEIIELHGFENGEYIFTSLEE